MLGGRPTEADVAARAAKIVTYTLDCMRGSILLSSNAADLLGIRPGSSLDEWRRLIIADDQERIERAMKNIAPAAPSYEIEYRMTNAATGRTVWVLDRGEAEFDGKGRLIFLRGAAIDLGTRASMEGEFRQSARLRSVVFEAARMAAWHFNAQSGRFAITDELMELLDIGRRGFENTPEAIEQAVHPDDKALWREAHARALTPGGRMEAEFRVLLSNGGIRWLLSRGEVIRRRDGRALESYGVMIDITERKLTEAAAARLAAIVESSEDAIISKSLTGIILSWNSGAERLLGYAPNEIVGQPIDRILPAYAEPEETRILSTIRMGDSISPFESVRMHKSGREVHVSVAVSPIRNRDGKVTGASTIARDITERRRTIETLRTNETRLRLALHSAHAGAWDFNVITRDLHWSPEMYSLYGIDQGGGLPRREDLIARISSGHRKRAQKEFSRALLQGGAFTLEFPIMRGDGREIWTAISGDVIRDSRGRPVSARGIDQDITERKGWEKRQAILLRELSHRVKNSLAVIQSVARQTLRSTHGPQQFVEAFEGRIHSLSASHNLLTEADWSGAPLAAVIRGQAAALGEDFDRQFSLEGPEIILGAEMATRLGLVIHELATNAARYGALSVPAGRIRVIWKTNIRNRLRLFWCERGGPPILSQPAYRGFGTALVQSSALRVKRHFARRGLTCWLELAL